MSVLNLDIFNKKFDNFFFILDKEINIYFQEDLFYILYLDKGP